MLLENKVVIVTGAASPRGIGKATAKALAAQGARIVILDLSQSEAQSAARDLGRRPSRPRVRRYRQGSLRRRRRASQQNTAASTC